MSLLHTHIFRPDAGIHETRISSHCCRLHGSNHSFLLPDRPFRCLVDAAMPLSASDGVVLSRMWRTAGTPCDACGELGGSLPLQPVSAQHRTPSCSTTDSAMSCSGEDTAIHQPLSPTTLYILHACCRHGSMVAVAQFSLGPLRGGLLSMGL